jgi:hypothetical protein
MICPSQFRRVRAATLARSESELAKRVTILCLGGRHNPAYCAKLPPRKNVDRPQRISMSNETASRTAIEPSLGFVSVPALGASLRTIGFIYQFHGDATRRRFVFNLLAQLAVTPVGNLLLGFGFCPFAIGHVAHVAKRQRANFARHRHVHSRPAHLMLNIAAAPLLLGGPKPLRETRYPLALEARGLAAGS